MRRILFFPPTLKEKLKHPTRKPATMRTDKINITADRHFTAQTEGQLVTAVLRYGGESGNMNSYAFNKLGAVRQFSASNPPQRKAANRYMPF